MREIERGTMRLFCESLYAGAGGPGVIYHTGTKSERGGERERERVETAEERVCPVFRKCNNHTAVHGARTAIGGPTRTRKEMFFVMA